MPEELPKGDPMVKAWDEATPKLSSIEERGKYGLWRQMLSRYTRCEATMPSDKLIAISGLTKEFAQLFNDECVAGLWRKNLVNELLWQKMISNVAHGTRPKEYRAPSWSWASIDMDVKFVQDDELEERDYVEILDVDVKPAGSDATGAVESASILLRGYLVEIQRPRTLTPGLNDVLFDAEVDRKWTTDKLYFLPLRQWRWVWELDVKQKRLAGLVLRANSDYTRVVYERVGVLNLDPGFPLSYLSRPPTVAKVEPIVYEPEATLAELLSQIGRTYVKHVEFEWIDADVEPVEICIV